VPDDTGHWEEGFDSAYASVQIEKNEKYTEEYLND